MRWIHLIALLLLSMAIGCGATPKKQVDRDTIDKHADDAHRDLDRNTE